MGVCHVWEDQDMGEMQWQDRRGFSLTYFPVLRGLYGESTCVSALETEVHEERVPGRPAPTRSLLSILLVWSV